ncbi:MAG: helix-turn-helix transcriptional regulator [Clostridia bacterium]|nr:helix-turn-helix transcriptional regulator [Clostridia bacterium]
MNRIKSLRTERNINQDVLAKLLGLEIAGVSKLETGRVPLKDEYIIKLADYFNVSTDYLLGKSNLKNFECQTCKFLDITGLDNEDIKEIQKQVDYIKKLKGIQ